MKSMDDLPDVTPDGQALIRAHIHKETRRANERAERAEQAERAAEQADRRVVVPLRSDAMTVRGWKTK